MIWITVLLTCVGVSQACLTSSTCVTMDNEATAAMNSNQLDTYCSLKSKALACFSADVSDCDGTENPTLDSMKSVYYTQCSITAQDVMTCAMTTQSCLASLNLDMNALSTGNTETFCNGIESYLSCVRSSMSSCNSRVSIYDVTSNLNTMYDQYCGQTAESCTLKVYSAGCQDMLVNLSSIPDTGDYSAYCSTMESYMTCIDNAVATCAQPVNKTEFTGPVEQSYSQLCSASTAVQSCQIKLHSCNLIMADMYNNTNNITATCGIMEDFMTCVDTTMVSCDPSLTKSDVIQDFSSMEANFNMMCGGGFCPGLMSCFQAMAPAPGEQPPSDSPDLLHQCDKMKVLMPCMESELQKCNIPSQRSYGFGDLSTLLEKACLGFVENQGLTTCESMTQCMGSMSMPTDPSQMITIYQDPQFMCSLMKSTLYCAETTTTCNANTATFTGLMDDTNAVCPEAPMLFDVTGPGNTGSCLNSCMMIQASMSRHMGNATAMCGILREFMSCVNNANCESSIKQESLAQIEPNFNMMCGGTDNYCPETFTCMEAMAPAPGEEPTTDAPDGPDIIRNCGKLTTLLTCMDTERNKCDVASTRNYDFAGIKGLFEKACLSFVDNPSLMTCSQMTSCTGNISLPSDPVETSKLYHDPQFWCSLMKSTMTCAENSRKCDVNTATYTNLLAETNELCPEAQVRVTVTDNNDNGATSIGARYVIALIVMLGLAVQL